MVKNPCGWQWKVTWTDGKVNQAKCLRAGGHEGKCRIKARGVVQEIMCPDQQPFRVINVE